MADKAALLTALALAWRLDALYRLEPARPALSGQPTEAQRLFEAMRDQGLLPLDSLGRCHEVYVVCR